MSIILLLGQIAFAQSPEQVSFWPTEDLQEIYSLWYQGSFTEAQGKIKSIREELESSKNDVVRRDMFYIQFLAGMINFGSQKEKDAILSWREAILWNPNMDFPDYLYTGSQMGSKLRIGYFFGLRGEVDSFHSIHLPKV